MMYCEAETLLRAYEGDAEAAYALYEANLPLIRKIAVRYARIDYAVGLDDLMQEGYLATLEAAQAYADTDKSWAQTLVWALKRRYGQLFPRRRQRMVSLERAPAGALARPDAALTRTENREELRCCYRAAPRFTYTKDVNVVLRPGSVCQVIRPVIQWVAV